MQEQVSQLQEKLAKEEEDKTKMSELSDQLDKVTPISSYLPLTSNAFLKPIDNLINQEMSITVYFRTVSHLLDLDS